MNILKQSTAATIKLGPFVDDTDGKTAETALTIGQADIRLSKNGGDIAQTDNATGATHDELGYYDIPLNTTDTGTLGRLRVLVSKAGALPVWQDFVVVTANVYDSMFSTDKLDVAVVEMATDVLTAAAVKADAVTKIQSGLATPTNITAGTITTVTNLTNLPNGTGTNQISLSGGKVLLQATQTGVTIPTVTAVGTTTNLTNLPTMPTDWVTAAGLKADAVTEIQSGLATAAALDAVDNFIDTEVAAILAAVDTEVAAIKAKTDNLPASPAAVGSAMTLTAAYDKAKDDVLTPLGVVDGIVDAIKVQTDKIPATPASAGEYTANIGAIKAKTDNLPLSPASSGEYTSALTAIQNDLDNPNQYKADVSGLTTSAELAQTEADIIAAMPEETVIPDGLALETSVQAIKAKTDNLPATPASAGEYTTNIGAIKAKTDNLPANTNTTLAAIQADLDNPAQYKADVSGLATTAHVQEVENKIDAIDVTVNTIPTNPLLDTAYTAPNNAGIAAIQEKTEQLTFTAPNKVDANADVVLSPEAIEGMATAIRDGLPEDIWSSSIRTLTQSPAEIIATVLGADITQIRGNSWAVQLTGVELESIQQLAIKHSAKQHDSAALLFVDSVNGLTVLNGVAQDGEDSSKASLTYDGTILTLTVDASITAQLPAGSLQYGVQSISNNGIVSEPYGGTFRVLADIVRATD